MISKITIEVDFNNDNQPVIQIIHRESDDVRDKLIKAFIEKFRYDSQWLHCKVINDAPGTDRIYYLSPLPPEKLKEHSEIMQTAYKEAFP